uniref:Peptidase A1 domain-containing protein n=1 Tax=Rhabditophanes sp. KR3021 TaxID=114890 RepID=A0AC35TQJ2_9BILA
MKMDPETIKSQIIKLGKSYRGYYSLDPALITSSVVPTSEMVSDLPITVNVIKSEPIEIQSINIIQSPLPNAELTVEASQGQTFNIPDNSVLSSFTHEIIENVKVDADSIERFRDVSIDSTIELPEGFAVVGDMYCMIGNDNVYLPVIIDEQGHAFAINAEQKMFEISFDKNLAPVYIDKNSGQVFGGYKMIAGEKMLSDINGAATDYQKISLDPSLYFDGEMEDSGSDIEIPYGYKLVDDLLVSINNSPLYYPVVTCVESENKMETGKAYVFDDKGQRYDVLFDTNQIPVTQSGGVVSPGLKLNGIDPPTRSLPKGPYESKIFDQF